VFRICYLFPPMPLHFTALGEGRSILGLSKGAGKQNAKGELGFMFWSLVSASHQEPAYAALQFVAAWTKFHFMGFTLGD
jgi:hypothetical protein